MNHMYAVTVINQRGAQLQFLFDAIDPAMRAFTAVRSGMVPNVEEDRGLGSSTSPAVEISDDFGTTAVLDRASIIWCWMSDLVKDSEGKQNLGLLQARAQASMQRKAAADPLMRGSQLINGVRGVQQ
jgi:hypothetical protein